MNVLAANSNCLRISVRAALPRRRRPKPRTARAQPTAAAGRNWRPRRPGFCGRHIATWAFRDGWKDDWLNERKSIWLKIWFIYHHVHRARILEPIIGPQMDFFYLPLCTWHIKSYIVLSIHPLFCFSFEMCYWHFCPLWPICLPSCILFNGKTVLHPEMVGDLIPPLSRAVLQISKPFKCASKSALSPFNARHQIAQFHFLAFLNLHQNVQFVTQKKWFR